MTEAEVPLKKKDNSVNLLVHPDFRRAAPILKAAWTMYGSECVVTSGRDGKHSRQSAHDDGNALDLRTSNLPASLWSTFGGRLAKALVDEFGPYWYVVLERDHYHMERVEPGKRPNIVAFRSGIHFYKQMGL